MILKEKAYLFAEKAHRGQTRKNSSRPYITHPKRVAERLEKAGLPEPLIFAGYLHDVVEDTGVTIQEIEQEFGREVAELVAAHTEDKSKSWLERKRHTIETVKKSPLDIKCLIIADKLDNLLGMEEDLKLYGEQIWENFNAGPVEQKWYNESIANHMYEGIDPSKAPDYFREYEEAVKRVFS